MYQKIKINLFTNLLISRIFSNLVFSTVYKQKWPSSIQSLKFFFLIYLTYKREAPTFCLILNEKLEVKTRNGKIKNMVISYRETHCEFLCFTPLVPPCAPLYIYLYLHTSRFTSNLTFLDSSLITWFDTFSSFGSLASPLWNVYVNCLCSLLQGKA